MDNKNDNDRFFRDAVKYGYVIQYCLGCNRPKIKIDELDYCHDCPAGITWKWHPYINIKKL